MNLIPTELKLSQNFPNPFNPTTLIIYQINKTTFVSIKVYDILGREIRTLVNSEQNDLVSGVYIYRIQTNEFTDSKKMILMK